MKLLKALAPVIIFALAAIAASQTLQNFSSGGASLSGGVNNTVPKWTGASTLGNSSLTDNGAIVTGTEQIQQANGTAAAPSYSFTNFTSTGVYAAAGPLLNLDVNAATPIILSSTQAIFLAGTAASPSITNSQGSNGIYFPTSTTLGLSAGGNARFGICGPKTLSNTSGTVGLLATVGAASNTAGGLSVTFSVTCTDATNFDADTITCTQSWKNHAGTITFGAQACTASTAINDSGSCTIAPTFTAGASLVNVNVTPVITTIVPTTTLGYSTLSTNSAGAIACQ